METLENMTSKMTETTFKLEDHMFEYLRILITTNNKKNPRVQ